MWTFRPTVLLPTQTFELPRPVTTLKVVDSWEAARFKVPARPGEVTRGQSPGGVTIAVRGQIGTHAGVVQSGEPAMFEVIDALRTALHGLGPDESFGLAVFRDGAAVRGFAECSVLKVEYDLSDAVLFGYSMTVRAGQVGITDGPLV